MVERSFVMTCYNADKKIFGSLDSIIPFLGVDDEFVCVDNFSRDDTWKILNLFKTMYPDKDIKLFQHHCNRGKGRDYCYKYSAGKFHIIVDADTIYYPLFWEILDLWEKDRRSLFYYLCLNEAWHIPHDLLNVLGGFPHINTSEDSWLLYKTVELNRFRWCPLSVGDNWLLDDKEKRFTHSFFERLWRTILSHKDKFFNEPRIHLISYLKFQKSCVKNNFTFVCFWVPLFCILSFCRFFIKMPEEVDFNPEWIIDFDIDGKRYTWFWIFWEDDIVRFLPIKPTMVMTKINNRSEAHPRCNIRQPTHNFYDDGGFY